MQIFLDSANIADIQSALSRGVRGVTTNPSLLAREEGGENLGSEIIRTMYEHDAWAHISIEAETSDPDEIIAVGVALAKLDHPGLALKIPIGWDELAAIRALRESRIKINVTACMTVNQALIAANAGADYVSIFWGRIQDIGGNAADVVSQTAAILDRSLSRTDIIVGSVRSPIDVAEAFAAGADICTVPFSILERMCQHPQTTAIIEQFMRDAGQK